MNGRRSIQPSIPSCTQPCTSSICTLRPFIRIHLIHSLPSKSNQTTIHPIHPTDNFIHPTIPPSLPPSIHYSLYICAYLRMVQVEVHFTMDHLPLLLHTKIESKKTIAVIKATVAAIPGARLCMLRT